MKFSKKLYFSFVFIALAALFGCSPEKPAAAPPADDKAKAESLNVSAVLMALNSDYWHMVESGIQKGGKDFSVGVSITATTNESDVTGQIAMIEDQITAGAHALIIAPTDTKALLPALRKAQEKNINVVLIDMDLDAENSGLRASFIGTSEYEAGQEVGKYIVANFQPSEIAVIRGLAGLPSHDARSKGMSDVVTKSGFKVVTEQPADSERGKAVSVAENILESTPNVKIIYATNDEMALGAYQAVEGKKKTKDIFVIGFDGSPDAVKSIKDNKLGATLAQQPVQMGYMAVEALKKIMGGGTVPKEINTPTKMVDKKNVEEFEKTLK